MGFLLDPLMLLLTNTMFKQIPFQPGQPGMVFLTGQGPGAG